MKKNFLKIILINIFLILFFSLGAEILLRIFLSRRNFTKLAIFEFTEKLRTYFHVNKYGGIEKINLQPEFKCLSEGIIAKDQELFNFLYEKYEVGFREFIEIAKPSKVIMLYLPMFEKEDESKYFFESLAKRYSIDFLDLSNLLRTSSNFDDWTLHPENGHLSRFGNKKVARELVNFSYDILSELDNQNFRTYDLKAVKASLEPNKSNIWNIVPSMPYRVTTNDKGFRNSSNVKNDAKHIIVYGDSYTFGPYLPNHDTFTSLANKLILESYPNDDIQFLNAGIAGSTIFHQIETLKSTIDLNPNLIILQVLDNDIPGVSFMHMRRMAPVRVLKKELFEPSEFETLFIKDCKNKIKNNL